MTKPFLINPFELPSVFFLVIPDNR